MHERTKKLLESFFSEIEKTQAERDRLRECLDLLLTAVDIADFNIFGNDIARKLYAAGFLREMADNARTVLSETRPVVKT